MTNQLVFNNTQFNVVTRNHQIWLTSKEIAVALGYSKTNAITHIYNTNVDEFSPGMTEIVESNTSGNLKARTRIFSLRGAHLIAMFTRTPIAKEFRRWVLDVLDRETGQTANQLPESTSPHYYEIITSFCDGQMISRRMIQPGELLIHRDDHIEMMARSGYLVIHCNELEKMGAPELVRRIETTRRMMGLWAK
ncbi:BRO-N domain-containing protein [Salmonella enterica]|uniref:BRO-N domain-containing protein n=1 Tax=Salmonella enterica TaxID=28901 RepID=UPI0020CF43F2|nr:Bro-N domain-containing protein [Salmonella enterica]